MPGKTLLAEPINPKYATPRRLAAVRKQSEVKVVSGVVMSSLAPQATRLAAMLPSGREADTSCMWRPQQGLWVMNLFKHIISVKCSLIYDFCIGKASCYASKCVNKTNISVALLIE